MEVIHTEDEVFAGTDSGDEQAFAMRNLEILGEIASFRRGVNGEHARAIIYRKDESALLVDPDSDFAIEWAMPDTMHPIDGVALSADGTQLAVAVNEPLVVRVFDLEKDAVIAEAKIKSGLKAIRVKLNPTTC